MTQEKVLALLKAGPEAYHSGQSMSRALGVSRAAVWKAVECLRNEGYWIDSVPNRGYCLKAEPDLLRAGALSNELEGCRVGGTLVCLPTVDSTNNELKRRAAEAPDGLAVLADEQTGGRGRRGKSFQSPRGQGIYLSVLLRPDCPLAELSALTAWIAVAVCEGIREACGAEAEIKWTNDVLLGGKKLCGILTELEIEAESGLLRHVIAGIGVNVGQTAEDFGPELSPVATSLALAMGHTVRRTELAACLLRALDRMYAAFPTEKERYLAEYRRRCVTTGRNVLLLRGDARRPAFAEAVEDDFSLRVLFPDGHRESITAGEVSVRGQMGYI
ncbi:MAG: biotin--[acetyl-CoA-carboxylase] ligase [Intestinimonas sp.]|jgi:BirA family biotin operon repressor/biotin-[acetyl-CoA-carboxylase] ligase|nr:biotin--[acetyl-CoA-carboxylase] ligase [Intestinimonas sp.]